MSAALLAAGASQQGSNQTTTINPNSTIGDTMVNVGGAGGIFSNPNAHLARPMGNPLNGANIPSPTYGGLPLPVIVLGVVAVVALLVTLKGR